MIYMYDYKQSDTRTERIGHTMNGLCSLGCAAMPLGDDTPVLLYGLLGCGALVLLIAVTALGKLSSAQKKKKKKKRKPPVRRNQ